jgi:hypothetical protein
VTYLGARDRSGSKAVLFANVTTLQLEAGPILNLPRDKMGEGLVRHLMGRWSTRSWERFVPPRCHVNEMFAN